MYDNGRGFLTFFLTVAQWSLSAIKLASRVKTRSVFFPPPMHENIKQRRLPVANQASVAGGLKRLNSNARNPAATPLCGEINNAKLRFQSHECEAGFSNRWSTQTGEDCLFSAALVASSGEHSNSDANMQREPALPLPSKEKKNRKEVEGATCFCTAAEPRSSGRAY